MRRLSSLVRGADSVAPLRATSDEIVADAAADHKIGIVPQRTATPERGDLPNRVRFCTGDQNTVVGSLPRTNVNEAENPRSKRKFNGAVNLWALASPRRWAAGQKIKDAFRTDATELNLDYMELKSLPNCLVQLSKLRSLNLSGNRLKHLPKLPLTLTTLIATNNHLVDLLNLPAGLDRLYVKKNALTKLQDLPDSLGELSAADNRLVEWSKMPSSLRQAYVNGNQLTEIPKPSDGLQTLNIDRNLIERLPPLPQSLTSLSLRANPIQHLPMMSEGMTTLEVGANEAGQSILDNSIDHWHAELRRFISMRIAEAPPIAAENVDLNAMMAMPLSSDGYRELKDIRLPKERHYQEVRDMFTNTWVSSTMPEKKFVQKALEGELCEAEPSLATLSVDMPSPMTNVYDVDSDTENDLSECSRNLRHDLPPAAKLAQHIQIIQKQIELLERYR